MWNLRAASFEELNRKRTCVSNEWHRLNIVNWIKLEPNCVRPRDSMVKWPRHVGSNQLIFEHRLWSAKNYRFDCIIEPNVVVHVWLFSVVFLANRYWNSSSFSNSCSSETDKQPAIKRSAWEVVVKLIKAWPLTSGSGTMGWLYRWATPIKSS